MNDPFARLGLTIVRYRWVVLGCWVVLLSVTGAFFAPKAASVMKAGGLVAPGSESDTAARILEDEFNLSTLNNAPIVFHSDTLTADAPAYREQVQLAADRLSAMKGVRRVLTVYNTGNPGLVSADGHTSVAIVSLDGGEGVVQKLVPDLREAIDDLTIEHYMTGTPPLNYDFNTRSEHDLRKAEMVTVPVVLLLLLIAFRTVVSAIVPLVLGGAAVVSAMAILYLIGSNTDVSIFAVNVASMIGLGLGIDFSLIVVNRFREELDAGRDVPMAMGVTMATAGRSILYSGMTVLLGMLILTVMFDLMVIRSISLGVALVALTALASGLTMLPALLAVLGRRLELLRVIPRRPADAWQRGGVWYRLSHAIMGRPWVWLIPSVALLLVMALPTRELKMLGSDPGLVPASLESVKGGRLLDAAFGANRLTPIQVVMQTDEPGGVWTPEFLGALDDLTTLIRDDPRTSDVTSLATFARAPGVGSADVPFEQLQPEQFTADPQVAVAASQFVNFSNGNDTAVITIVSKFGEFTPEHEAQIRDLRGSILDGDPRFAPFDFYVGGSAASFHDFKDKLYGRFPYLVGSVLLLSFIILMMFFQSVFLPLKAILMNVAGIVATYGVLVAIFQYGWGASWFGFESLGAIGVATPAILFVILFSLSTDYEVFMLSRVKEYYRDLGNNEEAVALGLEHTAGVITAAGLILIGVFGSFATAGVISIKEIGLGLAVAVLLDTTIIRVIMVPATMRLMGSWNWWMPGWLARIVPELREGHLPELAPAVVVQGSGVAALAASDGTVPAWEPPVASAPRMAGQLRPIDGPPHLSVIPLPRSRPFVIGRDEGVDLQVPDARISRKHARIDHRHGEFILTDLNSTNGVWVNGTRISTPVALQPDDEIEISNFGEIRFRFELRALSETPT